MKDVFDVTFQSALDVFNYGLVLIYGLFLSVSIAGGCTEKRDKKLVALLCPVFLVLQSLFALTLGTDKTMQLYPLIVHLPLVLIRKSRWAWLWSAPARPIWAASRCAGARTPWKP